MSTPAPRLGHLPDPPTHPLYVPARQLVGAAANDLPSESGLMLPLVDRILDQPAQTCTGHGIAGAIYVREAAERLACIAESGIGYDAALQKVLASTRTYPSPTFVFSVACLRGRVSGAFGSRPSDAWGALLDWGYCGIDAWPDDLAHLGTDVAGFPVAKQPDDGAYRLAADQRTVQAYRLFSDGDAAVQETRQGLCQLYPGACALKVDQAYVDNRGELWDGPSGPVLGGHYVYFVGYDAEALLTVSSYGAAHGAGGIVRVSWRAYADYRVTSDRYLVTFAEAAPPLGS